MRINFLRQSILDSIVVSSMPESDRANFGRVRLFGELGNGVTSSIMMSVINNDNYGFEVSRSPNDIFLFSHQAFSILIHFLCEVYIHGACNSLLSCVLVPSIVCSSASKYDQSSCTRRQGDKI